MNKWQEIWNKNERINKIILEMLIKADGFDSGAGSFDVNNWLEYTNYHFSKIDIKDNDTIFDVGCGSGAFLFPLYLKNYKIGGMDYSKILIELAKKIMPEYNFECNEAINLDITKKYNIVFSHSVFHYFKDLEYAKIVIKKMIKKANKKIVILDINDKTKEQEYHQIRMAEMDKKEYEEKYKGLEHLFYEKQWFEDIANEFNVKKIDIFDQTFENYTNSKLRFNVIMEK